MEHSTKRSQARRNPKHRGVVRLNMEHSEYVKLQAQLQDHFDGRYVKINDCEKQTEAFDKLLNKDNVRLAVIEQQQKVNNWLTAAIAGGIVALVIKVFVGG